MYPGADARHATSWHSTWNRASEVRLVDDGRAMPVRIRQQPDPSYATPSFDEQDGADETRSDELSKGIGEVR
jgi:hypothetical protein